MVQLMDRWHTLGLVAVLVFFSPAALGFYIASKLLVIAAVPCVIAHRTCCPRSVPCCSHRCCQAHRMQRLLQRRQNLITKCGSGILRMSGGTASNL